LLPFLRFSALKPLAVQEYCLRGFALINEEIISKHLIFG
jgi:hypothetical protein